MEEASIPVQSVESVEGVAFGGVQVHSSRNAEAEFEDVANAPEQRATEPHPEQRAPQPQPAGCQVGCSRFVRQVLALSRKNVLMLWRNRASTFIRLGSCIFFMLLMFCIIEAINVTIGNQSHVRNLPSPSPEEVPGIKACDRSNCIALAYAPAPANAFVPDTDALDAAALSGVSTEKQAELERVHSVMRSVISNNKGGALDAKQVMGFTSAQDMDDYILTNQGNVLSGVILDSPAAENTSFVMMLNVSNADDVGWFRADEKDMQLLKTRWAAVQVEVSKGIGRALLGAGELDIALSLQPFAHPPAARPPPIESSAMAPLFLFAAALFPFVMQISEVVGERESQLRQSLAVMGLQDAAYWASWHLFHLLTSLLGALVLCLAGLAFRYQLFVHNSFGVLFLTFFFFALAMTGLAYAISTLLRTAAQALVVGVCVFFLGFLLYFVVIFGLPWARFPATDTDFYFNCTAQYVWDFTSETQVAVSEYESDGTYRRVLTGCSEIAEEYRELASFGLMFNRYVAVPRVFALLPMTLLTKTLADLGAMADPDKGAGGYGLEVWNSSSYCAQNYTTGQICDPDYSVGSVWGIWFGLYLAYSLLALYLDNVLPDPMGVRKPLHYFLLPSYWGLEPARQAPSASPLEPADDPDVRAEEEEIGRRGGEGMGAGKAIEIRGLQRSFVRNKQTLHAVKGIQLGVERRQLFALLGPNGAGKTTLINMLIGTVPPSAGEALVEGHPVSHIAGMRAVRGIIGVCPQFDLLWDALSALEHLRLLAHIKGLPPASVETECLARLEEVRLLEVGGQAAGTFSGGMKRRLSVAIALLGDPRVLFLDEPTTGMDPVSRRCVWNVIEKAKQDRAVVLTTHSMEEADVLADRIAILAKGRLRCLGSSVHLKAKFGAGYSVAVGVKEPEAHARVTSLFAAALGAAPSNNHPDHLTFKVGYGKEGELGRVFEELEGDAMRHVISAVQLSMSSLEDVFLRIAKAADAAEAQDVEVTLPSGHKLKVRVGHDAPVFDPSGARYRLEWGLDESGSLACIHAALLRPVMVSGVAGEGVRAGDSTHVTHEGVRHEVRVPEGIAAGEAFRVEVWLDDASPQQPPAPRHLALDVAGGEEGAGGGSGSGVRERAYGLSAEELAERVHRLAPSLAHQSAAIFHKSLAVQRRRWCSNVCLCFCPSFCIALIFVMQILMELLWQPAVSQRCTYCGPTEDGFGKAYCGGTDCLSFFFPHKGKSEELDWACGELAEKERCWVFIRAVCEHKAATCGGNGHPSCFWPDAPSSKGSNCQAYRSNDWDKAQEETLLLLKALGFQEFQEFQPRSSPSSQPPDTYDNYYDDPADDSSASSSSGASTGYNGGGFDAYSVSFGQAVVEAAVMYSPPQGLPLPFAPTGRFLGEEPVVFAGEAGRRIMPLAFPDPLAGPRGATQRDSVLQAGARLRNAMFLLLALPRMGCAELGGDGRAEKMGELSVEGEEAVCALLQHDLLRAGTPQPCCLDFTEDGDSPAKGRPPLEGVNVHTWPASEGGGHEEGSGEGQAEVRSVLADVLDEEMAGRYLATGNLSRSAFRCVRPRYTPDLQRRLGGMGVVGLEEGLAVIAQALALPLAVHPEVEPDAEVPGCTAGGGCGTAQGRWAQACDLQAYRVQRAPAPPYSDPYAPSYNSGSGEEGEDYYGGGGWPGTETWSYGVDQRIPPLCWQPGANTPCSQLHPELLPDAPTPVLPSCLCVYVAVVRQLAARYLAQNDPDQGWDLVHPPQRPFASHTAAFWAGLVPFGIAGLTLTSPTLDGIYEGRSGELDLAWRALGRNGGDNWWTLPVNLRYADCLCSLGGVAGAPVCSKYKQTGSGDCVEDWDGCEWNEECVCGSASAPGYPQRPSYDYSPSYRPDAIPYTPDPAGGGAGAGGRVEDGCYSDMIELLARPTSPLQLLAPDCETGLVGLRQQLHLLFNVTRQKLLCVSAPPAELPDKKALDAAAYAGHLKQDQPLPSLPGLAVAVDLSGTEGKKVRVNVMLNETRACGEWAEDDCRARLRPLRHLATLNAVLEGVVLDAAGEEAGAGVPLMAGVREFPAGAPWGTTFDLGSAMGPFLFAFTFLVLFPSIVVTLVQEKVFKIRIMMRMMGLSGGAFWGMTYAFWLLLFTAFTAVFLLIVNLARTHTTGYRIGMFARVDGGVQVMFFLGYMLCTISFAFLWSTLLRSIRVAQVLSVLWIIVLVVLAFVFDSVGDIFNSDGVSPSMKTLLTLFPPLGFYRGLTVFRLYADTWDSPALDGSSLTWANAASSPLPEILIVQFVEAGLLLLLAIYLDLILHADFGVPRHPLWCFGVKRRGGGHVKGTDHMDGGAGEGEEEEAGDVAAERVRVQGLLDQPPVLQDAVMTSGLRKVYEGAGGKEAVKPLTLGVHRAECFGMLGPNGAGKTTTINMLVGFTEPSAGNATVEGLTIRNHMHLIYSIMGVCPQHDLLWLVLTARQHLYFYGRLKNLRGAELKAAAEAALRSVNLMDVIDTPAGTYSGGMKRRLSVAISLIGMPLVCYLDEPSTGLDPASRRLLWACVREAKKTRAVLLTTHSMEEAEGLCDRLGIFVSGRLRCVGAPNDLTLRFGGLFVLTFLTTSAHEPALSALVLALCPSAAKTYALAGTNKYELPAGEVRLSAIFGMMTGEKERGRVLSWGISSATLEDAFIKIANPRA